MIFDFLYNCLVVVLDSLYKYLLFFLSEMIKKILKILPPASDRTSATNLKKIRFLIEMTTKEEDHVPIRNNNVSKPRVLRSQKIDPKILTSYVCSISR